MVRAAVVGVGYLGRFHAQKYKSLSDSKTSGVSLVGVYDASAARCAEIAKELSVKAFATLEEVANEIDAVTIATTTKSHFETARFFLQKKIHVNVEKPMTVTAAEAKELVELAARNGVKLSVGHSERFNPSFQFLRHKFTAPQFLELRRHAPFRLRGSDVSVVLDLMVHDLDMVVSWAQEPIEIVSALGGSVVAPTLDWAECSLRSGKALYHISVSRVASVMTRVIRGFSGSTSFITDFQTGDTEVTEWQPGSETPLKKDQFKQEKKDHLLLETEAFLNAVQGKAPLMIPGEQGQEVLELALAIEERIRRA